MDLIQRLREYLDYYLVHYGSVRTLTSGTISFRFKDGFITGWTIEENL